MPGTNSQLGFGGRSRVTSLSNDFSAGYSSMNFASAVVTQSGTTVAGTSNLKLLYSATGGGSRLNGLTFACFDSTTRTVRMVITIDGAVVFDKSATVSDSNTRVAVGAVVSGAISSLVPQPVDSTYELKIEFGCSLAETNKITFGYSVEGRQ